MDTGAAAVVHWLQGKTKFQQKKECCAGSLEGRFLKMLVAATGKSSNSGSYTSKALLRLDACNLSFA